MMVLVLVLLLAGAGYWFFSKGGIVGPAGSAFDIACHLPKTARAAWMMDLRGVLDPAEATADLHDVIAQMPEVDRKKLEKDMERVSR